MSFRVLFLLCILPFLIIKLSFAQDDPNLAQRIQAQLNSEGRDQYDPGKDPGRKPVEVMQFMGVTEGMTVIDFTAGGGYNTEILSAAVGITGTVWSLNSHFVLRLVNGERNAQMMGRLENNRLPNVKYVVVDMDDLPFIEVADIAFWGMNFHDIYNRGGEAAAVTFLKQVHTTLKPGGLLSISDHIGDAGNDNGELHRIEPQKVFDSLEKAGFDIVETSDLMANPDDDHSKSIYTEGLRYFTDRILIKARKR